MVYIAHEKQTLKDHLEGVAYLCRKNAEKIGCADYGEILGLLHDLGKYSQNFQNYIKSAVGFIDPDNEEEFVDTKGLKGKIDHSTAGAQFLWKTFFSGSASERYLAQVLSLSLVSHHSGLIDCLTTDSQGTYDVFTRRLNKKDEKTHFSEISSKMEITERLNKLINETDLCKPLEKILIRIYESCPEKNQQSTIFQFQVGLVVRFLFSCLIDADRQNTADSEKPHKCRNRQNGMYLPWSVLIERLETHLSKFGTPQTKVDLIRENVSKECLNAAQREKGVFTLTVPTGGGKTLASLRFALHHVEKYNLERIIYIIPFTSIIDQNAEAVRMILETQETEKGKIVLEQHSNIGADKQTWKEKILTENWDSPIVFTTMVQFLEAFFGGGTRGARRMHQLSRSVVIFDEIQTLPLRCVHMFNNAVNFLVDQCESSVILCTATQPLLGDVDKFNGAIVLSSKNEIMTNIQDLYNNLKRVVVYDSRKKAGWSDEEIAELVKKEVENTGSCLVIVNMKQSARSLFSVVKEKINAECYHLSTGMCPAHRKEILKTIRERILPENNLPTVCISTQLIEAGVDVDFGSVIRFIAGLDSITQAAGRCNRNGTRSIGRVYIVNPKEENIDCLKDIVVGKNKTEKVLDDYNENPGKYLNDIIGPPLLEWYNQNYFFDRKAEMLYPVSILDAGRTDSLLNILSANKLATAAYTNTIGKFPEIDLRQSFMTAGCIFKSIDAPTQSVIVGYGAEGKNLVYKLCEMFSVDKQFDLLRKAQQYSVNLFPHEFKRLSEAGALFRVQEETDIFFLDDSFYNDKTGILMEPEDKEELLYV